MAFGTLLWKSVILTSVALLLRDLAGIGSAPHIMKPQSIHTLSRLIRKLLDDDESTKTH